MGSAALVLESLSDKSWLDAVDRWCREKADKASIESDKCIFRWLEPMLSGYKLNDINRSVVDALTKKKRASGVKNGTVNRMLALLRSVLIRACVDWEWVESVPKVRLLREPDRRVRYLTTTEAGSLLRELPEHLSHMAAFSLATGLRKGNVVRLAERSDGQAICSFLSCAFGDSCCKFAFPHYAYLNLDSFGVRSSVRRVVRCTLQIPLLT